jgi:hypothetical protein
MQVVCKSSAVMFCGFSFSILSSPSVESSETILLRRLILRLINQNSLYASSLADGRTPHVAPVCWRRDYMFRPNHRVRCVGTLRTTISCEIVKFRTQAGVGAECNGSSSYVYALLVSRHFSSDLTIRRFAVYRRSSPPISSIFVRKSS